MQASVKVICVVFFYIDNQIFLIYINWQSQRLSPLYEKRKPWWLFICKSKNLIMQSLLNKIGA